MIDLESNATLGALAEYCFERAETLAVAELDDDGTVLATNHALERLIGRSLAGERIHAAVAPSQWPALDRVLTRARPGWQRLMLGLAPDGHGVPLDFAVALRPLHPGWLLVAEPAEAAVTTVNQRLLALNDELAAAQRRIRRQHAELERQNEGLRELDQLKDALLANVSHDLRTPLTAILGYAQLMTRRGGLSERHARAAEVIERNARRLLVLVDDLLLLAQAEAGQLTLQCEPVDLSELAHEAVELARPLARQARLHLRCELIPAARVIGDRLRLGQLLDNLIANAVKFTPAGGRVAVSVARTAAGVDLSVADSGPGIPAAEQARLYEAFTRGAAASSPGTGLGLAIVREVAAAHGANVELDSSAHGARFTVRFAPAP